MKRVSVIVGTALCAIRPRVQEGAVDTPEVAKACLGQHHAGMDQENRASGQNKCHHFTKRVNVHRIRPIVSMAMSEQYWASGRSQSTDPGMSDYGGELSQRWTLQYWVIGVRRSLLQRALPGLVAAALFALVHSGAHAQRSETTGSEGWASETGTASYYGVAHQGKRTAAGSRFDMNELTAAHPWLPFGTKVSVTLQATGRSVIVTITDRLYSARRVIDLSMAAARLLGMVRQGVGTVSLSPG
jgi:rare lipoprotein A